MSTELEDESHLYLESSSEVPVLLVLLNEEKAQGHRVLTPRLQFGDGREMKGLEGSSAGTNSR